MSCSPKRAPPAPEASLVHKVSLELNEKDFGFVRGRIQDAIKSAAGELDLLVDLLLVRRLEPLHANVGKRLVKSPKTYVRDSGLVHTLLRLDTLDDVLGHPIAGASRDGHVLETLIRVAPPRAAKLLSHLGRRRDRSRPRAAGRPPLGRRGQARNGPARGARLPQCARRS